MVTVGNSPGAEFATASTSYLNFAAASCSGITCARSTRRLASCAVGPWQAVQVSSVAATPPWLAPVAKLMLSWQDEQVSRLTVSRQLPACGVSLSDSWWQVVQLRLSCG
jgi:hypothetical protein